MTSEQIRNITDNTPANFWLQQIAYQLAVQNEIAREMRGSVQKLQDSLVTPEPGKRDAVSEGRSALDCRSNRVVVEGHFCCFGHPAEATPNGKVCCICSKPEPKPGPREQPDEASIGRKIASALIACSITIMENAMDWPAAAAYLAKYAQTVIANSMANGAEGVKG